MNKKRKLVVSVFALFILTTVFFFCSSECGNKEVKASVRSSDYLYVRPLAYGPKGYCCLNTQYSACSADVLCNGGGVPGGSGGGTGDGR